MNFAYPAFKLVTVKHGSGWSALHVAIDHFYNFKAKPGAGDNIFLTTEATSSKELNSYIDELIDQLTELKKRGPARFKTLTTKELI